ncbi:MAG: Nudix family hydrolase [Gammaproteobacteria bacterium]
MTNTLYVSVGVIQNSKQEILLTQRQQHLHQGGKWEFAGGKVDAYETPRQALNRELYEELGIEVQRALPLIRIHHDYGDRRVILDVWQVIEFNNEPYGREGQPIRWVPLAELSNYDFPAANYPIVNAVCLPRHYVLTSAITEAQLYQQINHVLQLGYCLIRFRAKGWSEVEYLRLIPQVAEWCAQHQAELIIDGNPDWLQRFAVAGLHLNSKQLFSYAQRPIPKNYWLGVSCHDSNELAQAARVETDFALLSPVFPTPSHPEANGLGWPAFNQLVDKTNFPVYASGNMRLTSPAIWFGAQGVSGLRLFMDKAAHF